MAVNVSTNEHVLPPFPDPMGFSDVNTASLENDEENLKYLSQSRATEVKDTGQQVHKDSCEGTEKTDSVCTVLPEDECWLFKPSKISRISDTFLPIDNWLRGVFDSPDSCFFHARRNLLCRLEGILLRGGQTEAYKLGGSISSLEFLSSNTSDPPKRDKLHFSVRQTETIHSSNRLPSSISSESVSSQRVGTCQSNYNNVGTFTRSKKSCQSLSSQQNLFKRSTTDSHQSLTTGHFTSQSSYRGGSFDDLERTAANTDVQEIARIQEDNLKAEVAALAAAAAGRHGSQHSITSLCRNSPDGSCSNAASAPESPYSSNTRLSYTQNTALQRSTESIHLLHEPRNSIAPIGNSQFGFRSSKANQQLPVDSDAFHIHLRQNPYKILPQKPAIPITDIEVSKTFNQDIRTHLPDPQAGSQCELRNHFGFRLSRKLSNPSMGKS